MLIVLAIIGILSTITVVNLRPSSNKAAFELGAREVVTILNGVQQHARNQTLYSFDGNTTQKVPDHLNVTLRNSDADKVSITVVACREVDCAVRSPVATHQVAQIVLRGGPGTQREIDFHPPQGTLGINGSDKIILQSPQDASWKKTLFLSGNGRVTIE